MSLNSSTTSDSESFILANFTISYSVFPYSLPRWVRSKLYKKQNQKNLRRTQGPVERVWSRLHPRQGIMIKPFSSLHCRSEHGRITPVLRFEPALRKPQACSNYLVMYLFIVRAQDRMKDVCKSFGDYNPAQGGSEGGYRCSLPP